MVIAESVRAGGTSLPEHAHDEWRLVVVLEGAFDECASGGVRRCAASTVIVRAPGEWHRDVFRAPRTRYASIPIDARLHATALSATPLAPRLLHALVRGERRRAEEVISRIVQQALAPEPDDARVRFTRE